MKRYTNTSGGFGSMIIIMLVTLVTTLVLASLQTRLLLGIQRGQSSSDKLISLYKAESQINDVVAKILNDYPLPSNSTETLSDGTKLTIVNTGTTDNEQITVTADRPYSNISLEISKGTESPSANTEVQIILMLDCTWTMGLLDESGAGTRMEAQEAAAKAFIDQLTVLKAENPSLFLKLGVMVFGLNADWIKTNNVNISPNNNISFNTIKSELDAQFTNNRDSSKACIDNVVQGGTSLGTPLLFARDYFSTIPDSIKKIQILLTDTVANSRVPSNICPPLLNYKANCIDNTIDGLKCTEEAINFFACSLTDTNHQYNKARGLSGVRDPRVDVYAIKIGNDPSRVASKITNLLENPDNVKGIAYHSNGTSLIVILSQDIFSLIKQSVNTLLIRRVLPQ